MRQMTMLLALLFSFAVDAAETPVWPCAAPEVTLEPVDGGFVRLVTAEAGYLPDVNAVGVPALPQKTVLFDLPDKAEVSEVMADVVWETLSENVRVEPVGEPVREGGTPVPPVPDAAIYNGTEPWPASAVRRDAEGLKNGARILPVTVTPFRWHPVSGLLERAKSLTVRVVFETATGATARTSGTSRTSKTVRKTLALNSNNPTIQQSNNAPLEPGLYRTNPETNAFDYLLISPPDFYADWCWYVRQRQLVHTNLRFAVKNTAAIYSEYPFSSSGDCRNAAESIHAYLRQAVSNGLQYVVLGGAWLDAQNINGYTPYFVTGEVMSLSNCVPGIYGFPRENWRQIPADLFYACLDMNKGQKYPWDANADGKYIDQNDCQYNDTYPDVCVSRITLNPHSGRATPYNQHVLITNYVAKLARGEDRYFRGHYRYGMSAASTGSSKLRKTGDRMYYRELEFYDGMRNMFDPHHHDTLEDDEYSVRVRYYDQYSMWRPLREVKGMMSLTWTGGFPTLAAAMDDYYAADRDFGFVQAHGWAQGAAQFSAGRFATATGLTLFNGGSGPCETGYPDYHVDSGNKKVLQYNVGDAAVTNPDGGALASVNNSRWSWAGGGGGFAAMSYYMLNEMLIGFNQERMDVGHAWLKGVRNYWPAGRWGNTAGWVLSEQFLYGDPLVRLPEVPNVWWTGGETGVWDCVTSNWTNSVDDATTFDAAYNVYFNVQTNLNLDVAGEIAAMRLSIPVWEEDAVLTLAGTGTLRVMQCVDIAGTNTTLRFNVEGGVGHSGIQFLTGAGDLVFEGTNKFYVGGVRNARQVKLLGGGVTLDVDEFPAGNFPLVFDGPGAAALPLPNVLRTKNAGGLARFGSLAITNSYVKLSTVDAFGNGAPMTHTLVDSELEIAANVYYQRNGYPEGLNAMFLVDGDSSVTGSLGGVWTVKHTTTFALGAARPESAPYRGTHLTLSAETVNAGGRIVITNALPTTSCQLPTTNSVEVLHAAALSGDVTVGSGIRLVLDELPLSSVTSLTVGSGATIVLPDDASGYWQLVPVSSTFNCADDVTFVTASDPDAPLQGSFSKSGSYFKEGALYRWTGREGDWNVYFANRHPKLLFGDLGANDVTVRVATAVSPEFAFFANLKTKYVFVAADESASVLFSSVYFSGPTVFDVPVGATEYVDITTGTTRFSRVTAPYVHVAAGAGLALAGSHWTVLRLDAGAVLAAVPGEALDWNDDTSVVFPDDGEVLVDVGALELSEEPTLLIGGFGHAWTLSDLAHFRLVQPDAELRVIGGALYVVKGDGLKGPYELAFAGETNWNTTAWTAASNAFTQAWGDCALDWAADVGVSIATSHVSCLASLVLDCDVHANTLSVHAGTNDFAITCGHAGRMTLPMFDVVTLDLTDCHGMTDIGVDTGDARILTASSTNGTDVIRLRGAGSGVIELSGVTLVLDRPGAFTLTVGAQGILRVVAPQAYERFRIAKVPSDFKNSGLSVVVTDADGNAIDGFQTSVSDGALWCVPPALVAEVPPGTNDITHLVWRDALGNAVSKVDWSLSAGFKLIGTETSGVVIAKRGFASLWSRLSVSNEVTIYGNEVLTPAALPGPGALALAGAFTVKANVKANPVLLTCSRLKLLDASVLEISHGATSFDATAQDWSGVTGTGRVRFTDSSSSWIAAPSRLFADTLSVETASDVVLTQGITARNPFAVRNLSGAGTFRSDWGDGNDRPIRTVQAGVSAFSGTLSAKAGSRDSRLIVASDAETATTNKALVLSGAAVAEHRLEIETNGCVILTGSWKGPIAVAGLLVITDAAATNGVAVTVKDGGKVVTVAADQVPPVTVPPAYVAPTYPDDPVTPDEPVVDTRVRCLTAAVSAVDGVTALPTWTRLDWRDTNGVKVTEIDWADVTNVTIAATNGAARSESVPYPARILFDADAFTGVVHLADVTIEVRKLKPFSLAADSVGGVDFRLQPVPTATCDLLYVTTPNSQPSTSITVHDRYGRAISVAGEVAFNASARKYYLNVQDVNRPTYSNTFDTQYDDSLTSSLWFSGSGNLTYSARPDLFEPSRSGRALKGASMNGFAMHSHNGNPTVGMDNVNVWSLHFVAKLPTNNGGIIFGWGNKDSGNGVSLARVSENRAGVYAWENGGGARLVASADVPFASAQFHAYAITHDGQTLRFYVDGEPVQAVALAGKYPTRGFYQWFKQYGQNGGLQNGPTSVVDDLRLYVGTCLTPTSVRTIANDFPPWPEQPTAVVDVDDLSWPELYWSAGFGADESLALKAGAGSLLFGTLVTVSNALAVTGGAVPLRLAGEGALAVPRGLAVSSSLEIDASGLDGTNLASYAVADVPYARWLVRGPYSGAVSVTALPKVPDDYSVRVETFAALGVRLVFTAPRHALADAVGISVGDDSFDFDARTLGLHPTSLTNWQAYATWSAAPTAVGGLTVVGSAEGKVDTQQPYGNDASVARYFYHTSFDGNNDSYNGKTNGISISGLSARFDKYRVLAYLATDTSGANFGPVTIAGRTYCGATAGSETECATVADSTALAWGKSKVAAATEGVNVVISDVLTADTVSVSAQRLKNGNTYARGQIAAVEIVRVGEIHAFNGSRYTADVDATTDWTDGYGEGLKNHPDWRNGAFSSICLTAKVANATLAFKTAVTAETFRVVTAAGQTLTLRRDAADMAVYAFDFSSSAGTVRLEDGISLCGDEGAPCVLSASPRGTLDIAVADVSKSQRLMKLAVGFDCAAPDCTYLVHDAQGHRPDDSWAVLPLDGWLVYQRLDVDRPWYSLTFEDSLSSCVDGSTVVSIKPEGTPSYVDAGGGRRAMTGSTPYSQDPMPSVPAAWTIHAVAQMPRESNGMLFGYGRQGQRGVGLLTVDANQVAVAWWDSRGKFTVLNAVVTNATCQFHAYALVSTGSSVSLYVDGEFKGRAAVPVNPASPLLQFGSTYGNVVSGFMKTTSGATDDWRLYDGVLSTNAIRTLASRFPPWPDYRTSALTQPDTTWDDLVWSGEATAGRPLLLDNQGGTLAVTNACELTNALFATGHALTVHVTGEGVLKSEAGLTFLSGWTVDCSGLDGTNLAKYAVAGAPYVRWLVRGACAGGAPTVTGLPAMPDYFTIEAQTFADYGVRLVVTATPSVLTDAVSVSVGHDDFSDLVGDLGLYPDVATKWHAYANWSTNGQSFGKISVAALPMEDGQIDEADLAQDGLPTYFRHTSFDGNGPAYDGKDCGYALSNLTAFASAYRVIVYLNSNQAEGGWGPVTIGGRTYTGLRQGDETAVATLADSTLPKWGQLMASPEPREGVNVVISDVLTNDAITVVGHRRYGTDDLRARGQIAAFQVVKVGEIPEVRRVDYMAALTNATVWANGAGPGLDVLSDAWANDVSSTITLTQKTDVATLTFDTDVKARLLKVVAAAGQSLALERAHAAVSIAEYDFSEARGTVAFSNDVPAGTVVDLGPTTVFGGAMNGTFGTGIPVGATVRYAVPDLAVDVTRLKAGVTNSFGSATVTGAVFDNARLYRVGDGDALTVRPTGEKGHQFNGHVVVEGGRLVLEPTGASDRFWYGICGQSSFTQTGGETVVNVTSEATSGNGSFLFGVSSGSGGTIPVNVLGGTFSVENSTFCCWLDVPVMIGGTGVVKTKGLRGDNDKGAVTVNAGGTLSVGAKGVAANLKSFRLNGGLLTAHANAVTEMPITLGADSTIAADAGVTHTVRGAITGAGKITVGTADRTGTVVFENAAVFERDLVLAGGVLDVGTLRLTNAIERTGGKIQLRLTPAEEQTFTTVSLVPVSTGTTNTDYIVLGSGGQPVEPDWVTVEDGMLKVNVAGMDFSKLKMPLWATMVAGKAWDAQTWYDSSVPSNRVPAVYWGSAADVTAVIALESNAEVTVASCVTNVTVTGAGTVVSDGQWPKLNGLTDVANWHGTVRIVNLRNCAGGAGGCAFTALGNATSTVELDGVAGWFDGFADLGSAFLGESHPYALRIGMGGLTVNNGTSGQACTFARLEGTGALVFGKPAANAGDWTPTMRLVALDADSFTGTISVVGNAGVTLGTPTRNPEYGELVVAGGATANVDPARPWAAAGGAAFAAGATLNVCADGEAPGYAVTVGSLTLDENAILRFNNGENVRTAWYVEGGTLVHAEEWKADLSVSAAAEYPAVSVTKPTTLSLCEDGCVTFSKGVYAAEKLKIDTTGLDGTNLAKIAVCGLPSLRWLVKGVVRGDVEVTPPVLPAGYAATVENRPGEGILLVVRANREAHFGSVSINLSGNGKTVADNATEHGVHPIAGRGWNNFRPNSTDPVTTIKFVEADGTVTSRTDVTYVNVNSKEYDTQKSESLPILYGYHDDGLASEFTLTGIPFDEYRLVVYYATDSADYGFAPLEAGATSAEAKTYCGGTYPSAVGDYTRMGSVIWGSSNVRTSLAEGVNYLVTDVITGGCAYVRSVRKNGSDKGRATIAAIQVVRVGVLNEEVVVDYVADVTGETAWQDGKGAGLSDHDDWANHPHATITLRPTESSAVDFDTAVTAAVLSVTSAAGRSLVLSASTDGAVIAALDFTQANGAVTLTDTLGAATLAAGADTRLMLTNRGSTACSVGAGATLTLNTNLLFNVSGDTLVNGGTVRYLGSIEATGYSTYMPVGGRYGFEKVTLKGDLRGEDFAARTIVVAKGDDVRFETSNTYGCSEYSVEVNGGRLAYAGPKTWFHSYMSYRQTGGLVVFEVTLAENNVDNTTVIPGYSGGGTFTMNISGGTTDVSKTAFRFDKNTAINISGNGVLKTMGAVGNTANSHVVTLSGNGVMELGAKGWNAQSKAIVLAGGTLKGVDSSKVNCVVEATGTARLKATAGKTLAFAADVKGSGTLVCGDGEDAGAVVFEKGVASTLAMEGEFSLWLTAAQTNAATEVVLFRATAAFDRTKVTVCGPDGQALSASAGAIAVRDGQAIWMSQAMAVPVTVDETTVRVSRAWLAERDFDPQELAIDPALAGANGLPVAVSYALGLEPTNAVDDLSCSIAIDAEGNLSLTLPNVDVARQPNPETLRYVLQHKNDLTDEWLDHSTNSETTVTVKPDGAPARFFRYLILFR